MNNKSERPPAAESNFAFLEKHEPVLFQLGFTAEQVFRFDPNTTLVKLRQLGEAMAQAIAARLGISFDERTSQSDLLFAISRRIQLDPTVRNLFHTLRIEGNRAAHEFTTSHREAKDGLKLARQLAIWYHRAFGQAAPDFKPGPFRELPDPDAPLRALQEEIARLQRQLDQVSEQRDGDERDLLALKTREAAEYEQLAQEMDEERQLYEQLAAEAEAELARAQQAFEQRLAEEQREKAEPAAAEAAAREVRRETQLASRKLDLSEDETRALIDAQLRERGWEADSQRLRYAHGARPEAGKCRAIAEWPCIQADTGKPTRADYVLFIGLRPVATVEAKRYGLDVMEHLHQAEEYARDLDLEAVQSKAVAEGHPQYLLTWPADPEGKQAFRVPFAFATNGREYHRQVATKSGIWYRDLRVPANKSRALMGWYTPDELLGQLEDQRRNPELLEQETMTYLGLRPYQERAIEAVEQALLQGQREILIAMATGTGKTRTTIGLMYRLLKARLFDRVLFLVDRNALGVQAQDAFKDMRLEANQSFAEIYDVKELSDQAPDSKTKVHVATVQAMVRRVFESDDPIPIRQYDCIIVDEAHRGYTLDKEMTEGELELREFEDYVSSYRRVLDYFDAVRIGLTATPAAHTVEIFGRPAYTYSYREAVVDGYLVDYEPPYTLATRLSQEGIQFEAGSRVEVVNTAGEVRSEELPDELDFEVDDFNLRVLNENFNAIVCDELAKNYLDPASPEKTLVFCVNDQHADMVVRLIKEALDRHHGPQPDGTVRKITGKARDPQRLLREYKNERLPSIAVTVDLLTTGVDVPAICNLVFLRRVRSRILYEQMKGRATRLCPEIEKDVFRIFDCVRLYEALEAVDTMRPVVQQVNVSLEQLVNDLNNPESFRLESDGRTHAEDVHEQVLVKLQRLVRRAQQIERHPEAQEPLELVNTLLKEAGRPPLLELPADLKQGGPEATRALFADSPQLLPLLGKLRESLRLGANEMVISEHEDEMVGVQRGYGTDAQGRPIARPQDYLEAFESFVRDNLNKLAALKVVTTRPRDLTREDLKELRLKLAEQGFDEKQLRTAWKDARNEDVAATIIGYIRQAALGSPLVPFEDRVNRAMVRIKQQQAWSPNQLRWLDRLAAQLKKEVIIDDSLFKSPAFVQAGGRQALEAQFPGQLDALLDQVTHFVWDETA